ncbi:MAG: HAMP domain-containing histidine kinase, partial [Desulfuromonadales bacterium]|nr:HAMP domain-containing histidine kinase [Desulfuromonadales bacterium]NIR33829.1 HAMP domain-containing histidine kinase [Desulfuromonadales bacterium]NIS41709.1 HAMP domain-containing histidine kinase [Desulfuromonadales bacterium]
ERQENLDLRIRSVPWEYSGQHFTLFSITDISHEKRRRALERVFFHDVLNIAGSVKGYAELLRDYDLADQRELAGTLHDAMQQVVDEIEAQRLLLAAESRELRAAYQPVNSRMFLDQMLRNYRGHELTERCNLKLAPEVDTVNFTSDPRLLGRVLGNLIKNALEASKPGETVTLGCRSGNEMVEFMVHNPGHIPAEEQIQI